MTSVKLCRLGAALLMLAACGNAGDDDVAATVDSGSSDPADSRTDDCGPAPDPGELPGECEAWQCDPVDAPTCWSCALVPAHEGDPCTEVSDGLCLAGDCRALIDPAESGGGNSTTASHDVVVGDDTIPLAVFLPEGSGPFPVVIFTHGFMLTPADYTSYGQHLASWGYLVVMPDLPGDMFSPETHTALEGMLSAIIDWLASGPLAASADLAHLAMSGHSMGGKISLLLASADARPIALFAVDPVDAAGGPGTSDSPDYPSVAPELMPSITIPLALLGETVNASGGLGTPCAPADNNFHQYYLAATSPAIEIEIVGASHMSFLDNPNCGLTCAACPAGSDDQANTRKLTRRYMTAFFNVFVRGQDSFRTYLDGAAMADDVAASLVVTATKNDF